MAPVQVVGSIELELKTVIQDLYNISVTIHNYQGPASSEALINYIKALAQSLGSLPPLAASLPTTLPPEIIGYVDEGRNPDIYTREFVEQVQKENQFLKGRGETLALFKGILSREIRISMPELTEDLDKILDSTGGEITIS